MAGGFSEIAGGQEAGASGPKNYLTANEPLYQSGLENVVQGSYGARANEKGVSAGGIKGISYGNLRLTPSIRSTLDS